MEPTPRRKGRPPSLSGPRVHWVVYIRADHTQLINSLVTDAARNKLKYGARGEIVESLLETWIKASEGKGWQALGKPLDLPRERWELYIKSDLAAMTDLLLTEPTRTRVPYGARSWLIEELLGVFLKSIVQ